MILASLRALELRILHWITCGQRGEFADGLAGFVNDVVPGICFFVLLFLLAALTRRGRARLPRVVATMLLTMGLVHGARALLWKATPRVRPGRTFAEAQILRGPIARETCDAHPDLWVERAYPPSSPSFPSSHTVTGGACAIALTYASPWLGAAGWTYTLLEGWGRLYWGKHWPSDILGSLVLAVLLGMAAWRFTARFGGRPPERPPAQTPARADAPRG